MLLHVGAINAQDDSIKIAPIPEGTMLVREIPDTAAKLAALCRVPACAAGFRAAGMVAPAGRVAGLTADRGSVRPAE